MSPNNFFWLGMLAFLICGLIGFTKYDGYAVYLFMAGFGFWGFGILFRVSMSKRKNKEKLSN